MGPYLTSASVTRCGRCVIVNGDERGRAARSLGTRAPLPDPAQSVVGHTGAVIVVTPHDVAHGGEAVARIDGKTYFVAGAMPGETVAGEVVTDKGNWARLDLVDVREPSPNRIEPRCPHFSECGGCQWQFAERSTQAEWKRTIVAGQLAHLGGVAGAEVRPTLTPGRAFGYRNRMDFRVVDGKPVLFRPRSKQLVPLDECSLLHPELAALFTSLGPLHGTRRVTLRIGVRTGDRLVVLSGRVPGQAESWDAAVAATAGRSVRAVRGRPSVTEVVAGVTFDIGATAFFQNNTAGAEALVELVADAAAVTADDVLLDGFAGGGLFAATVGRAAARVIAIESDAAALRNLRRNLDRAHVQAHVVAADFTAAPLRADEPWTVAVVDPPRTGLGRGGVAAVTACDPMRVVYVSCDPASLARDARLLSDAGYQLEWATPVDMFPQTFHIETVARFTLTNAAASAGYER
jgi:23S rRNA (uracil1939-C5)-methyltransferase